MLESPSHIQSLTLPRASVVSKLLPVGTIQHFYNFEPPFHEGKSSGFGSMTANHCFASTKFGQYLDRLWLVSQDSFIQWQLLIDSSKIDGV